TTYLKPPNRTLGLFYPSARPERVAVPPPPDVATMLKDFGGADEVAAGEAFDPTPENIEARIKRAQLPSGMKLTLVPKQTRGRTRGRTAWPALGRRGEQGEPERGVLDRERDALPRDAEAHARADQGRARSPPRHGERRRGGRLDRDRARELAGGACTRRRDAA